MPSADRIPVNSSHSTMPWPKWGVPIAGSTSPALHAVCLSNRSYSAMPALFLCRRSRLSRERDSLLVTLALGHHGPSHPGELVGERDRRDLDRPPVHQRCQPRPMPDAVFFHEPYDGERAGAEQGSDIPVASLGDIAEPLPAGARILLGHEPDPGCEIPPAAEGFRIGDEATSVVARAGPTPGMASGRLLSSLDRCHSIRRR